MSLEFTNDNKDNYNNNSSPKERELTQAKKEYEHYIDELGKTYHYESIILLTNIKIRKIVEDCIFFKSSSITNNQISTPLNQPYFSSIKNKDTINTENNFESQEKENS